jgi:hypothetical protein
MDNKEETAYRRVKERKSTENCEGGRGQLKER